MKPVKKEIVEPEVQEKKYNRETLANVNYNDILPITFNEAQIELDPDNKYLFNIEMHPMPYNPNGMLLSKLANNVDEYSKVDPFIPIQNNPGAVRKLDADLVTTATTVIMNLMKEELYRAMYTYAKVFDKMMATGLKDQINGMYFCASSSLNFAHRDELFNPIYRDILEFISYDYPIELMQQMVIDVTFTRFCSTVYSMMVQYLYDRVHIWSEPTVIDCSNVISIGTRVLADLFIPFADMARPSFLALPCRIYSTVFKASDELYDSISQHKCHCHQDEKKGILGKINSAIRK